MTFPGAYDLILSFILGLGGLFAVIYGAAIAGSEWTWGTLKSTVARGESRSRYMLLDVRRRSRSSWRSGCWSTFVIGVAGRRRSGRRSPASRSTGSATPPRSAALPEQFAARLDRDQRGGAPSASRSRRWPAASWPASASGSRSTSASTFASIFLPDIVKYLPFTCATAAVGGNEGFGGGRPTRPRCRPDMALVLVTVWLVGSLVVAAGFTDRAEITG